MFMSKFFIVKDTLPCKGRHHLKVRARLREPNLWCHYSKAITLPHMISSNKYVIYYQLNRSDSHCMDVADLCSSTQQLRESCVCPRGRGRSARSGVSPAGAEGPPLSGSHSAARQRRTPATTAASSLPSNHRVYMSSEKKCFHSHLSSFESLKFHIMSGTTCSQSDGTCFERDLIMPGV